MPGFPIRTSSDQRFVGNSPRHNAASHVLHRLSMPRHPPYALVTKQKHTTNKQQTTTTHKQHDNHLLLGKLTIKKFFHKNKDARVHYTVLTQHTPHTNHQPNKSVINTRNHSRQHNCCLRHPTVHQHTIMITSFDYKNPVTLQPQPQPPHECMTVRDWCVSTRKQQLAATPTVTQPTNKPTTVSQQKINSLERR